MEQAWPDALSLNHWLAEVASDHHGPVTGLDGASGIPQLALRLRLFNTASAAAQIYLQAYLLPIAGSSNWRQKGESIGMALKSFNSLRR